jgi:uncharacterized protein YndB with AHSA1/START domain
MTTTLVLERTVPLPPEALWRAWTDPTVLPRWFCPRPWRTEDVEIDLRPGGRFATTLVGPDGERSGGVGCFLVVEPPHRLVWTNALGPDFAPAAPGHELVFTCTLTFEAVPGGTRYTARAEHPDAASAERHAKMGFHEGWGVALDQLVDAMRGHVAEG